MMIQNSLLCHRIAVDTVYVEFKRAIKVDIILNDDNTYIATVLPYGLTVTHQSHEQAFTNLMKLLVEHCSQKKIKQVKCRKFK